MKCDLPKKKLLDYFDEELAPEDRENLVAHISKCLNCQKELERLRQTKDFLNLSVDEEPNMNLIFVDEQSPVWNFSKLKRLVKSDWRKPLLGFSIAMASVLLILSIVNFRATYSGGDFTVQLSLLPRSTTTLSSHQDPLAAPVTRGEFKTWKENSYQMLQELIADAEERYRRENRLALTRLAKDLDLQRRQDLRWLGKGLEVFQSSNEDRFRRTNEVLQRLIQVAQPQGMQPSSNQNR